MPHTADNTSAPSADERTGIINFFRHKVFKPQLDLRTRMFYVLIIVAISVNTACAVSFYLIGLGITQTIVCGVGAVVCALLFRYVAVSGNYTVGYIVASLYVSVGQLTFSFLNIGGYEGGVPYFWILCVMFAVLGLKGWTRILFVGFMLSVYSALFLTSYHFPEMMTRRFDDKMPLMLHNVTDFLLVCVSLGISLAMFLRLYDKQYRELETARAREARYSKLKSEIFSLMSHEMRTPLTVMSCNAQDAALLIEANRATDRTLAKLNAISSEAARLAAMASGTLKILMSSFDSGNADQYEYDMHPVDACSLAGSIIMLMESADKESGRKMHFEAEQGVKPVTGDSSALTQLIWNLLQNAVDHSGGKNIWFRARQDGGMARIIIEDDGGGFAPDILPGAFEKGVTAKEGGDGLGLNVCREIVRRHGGEIHITNDGPGGGARVSVTLPSVTDDIATLLHGKGY